MDYAITILRSKRGEELFDDMVQRGLLAVRPMEEFEKSMEVMLRLTKKQRDRVLVPPRAHAALRPARGLPARAGGPARTVSAPSFRAGWPRCPAGLEPARCPVFVANEHEVAAPPEVVWKWLCRADLWPTWFRGSSDVRFEGGPAPELGLGARVVWCMLGATIRVTVRVCEPPRALDWEGGARGVHAYHAWLLEPIPGATLVLTQETEPGPLPWWLRWYLRGALHRAHQEWLESLEKVARNGPPKA